MAIIHTSTKPEVEVPAFDAGAVLGAHRKMTETVGKAVAAFLDACIVAGIPRDEAGCKAVAGKVEADLLDAVKAGLVRARVDIANLDRTDLWRAAADHGFIARSTASALCNAAARLFYWSGQKGADGQPINVRYSATIATDPRFALPWSRAFDPTKSVKADRARVQAKSSRTENGLAWGEAKGKTLAENAAELPRAVRRTTAAARSLKLALDSAVGGRIPAELEDDLEKCLDALRIVVGYVDEALDACRTAAAK